MGGGTKLHNTDYAFLQNQLIALLEGEKYWLANLANTSALIFNELKDLNWAGFYLLKDDELVLGPFQGKPACIRIALGNGVCGTAAKRREPIVVPDVREFIGHIVCDAASKSEVVVPLMTKEEELLGVLDLDSPILDRFNKQDAEGLLAMMNILASACDWESK